MVQTDGSSYLQEGPTTKDTDESLVKKRIGLGFAIELVQIPSAENEQADRLAKATSTKSFIQYSSAIEKIDVQVIPMGFD